MTKEDLYKIRMEMIHIQMETSSLPDGGRRVREHCAVIDEIVRQGVEQ